MRSGRGSWWWAQIMRALVYLALGIVCAGLAVFVGSPYPLPIRKWIMIASWILGMLLVDIRVRSEKIGEGS